jgi:hypothetical protein
MIMIRMKLIALLAFSFVVFGCSGGSSENAVNNANSNRTANDVRPPENPSPLGTPSNQVTAADVAKLKWLEGDWRGMDGNKPFYQRIRFEGTTMLVETFPDGSFGEVQNTSKFELKDGEFGNTVGEQRSAASSITDNAVTFIPAPVTREDGTKSPTARGNSFKFERGTGSSWNAVLDVPAVAGKPATQKTYKMEPWKPQAVKPAER